MGSAYAPSTAKNFVYQVNQYVDFCSAHRLVLFPPMPLNVARFITVSSTKNITYATLMNKISAIKKFYYLCGYKLNMDDPAIQLLLAACKREYSSASKPKLPIEPGHLLLIKSILETQNPMHQLFFVALIIQYFGCLRKSNLLPPSVRGYSPFKHLSRADIIIFPDQIVLSLPWTKTLQHANDILTIPIVQVPGSILDPVSIYKDFVLQNPLPSPRMPAFSLFTGSKFVILTQQLYIELLKLYLERLHLPSHAYSSHSVRRGAATTMFQAKVPKKLLKMHGGWKSSCYERYIQPSSSDKVIPSKLMQKFINSRYAL